MILAAGSEVHLQSVAYDKLWRAHLALSDALEALLQVGIKVDRVRCHAEMISLNFRLLDGLVEQLYPDIAKSNHLKIHPAFAIVAQL